MSTILKLIIEDDEGKTTVFPLDEGEVSVGRKEGNTIRLMERNVSRRHARIVREGEVVHVEDLDSYNGVRINGERVGGRFRVREGDLLEIGDYHLALQIGDDPRRAPPEDTLPFEETMNLASDDFDGLDAPDTLDVERTPPDRSSPTAPDHPLPHDLLSQAHLPSEDDEGPPATPPPSGRSGEDPGAGSLPPFPPTPSDLFAEGPVQLASDLDLGSTPTPTPTPAPLAPRRQGPAQVAGVPRLVCVSTEFAGRSFAVDRSELVLGRVEDNDIVIEHRSVSRNHAKLQYDGRNHKIIDLQSANGVLVNGEEYAMTNLRAGDLVELGHVRFRFVPAGEPFRPTAEEARELRARGFEVEGPIAPEAPPDPRADPSLAATVTEAARGAPPPEAGLADTEIDENATWRRSASQAGMHLPRADVAPRAPSTPAPAAVRVPSTRAPSTRDPVDRRPPLRTKTRAGSAPSRGRAALDYRTTMVGLIVVLSGLVGLLLFVVGSKGDARHDRRLEELYNQRDYVGVRDYFETHRDDFLDRDRAYRTLGRAEAKLEGGRVEDPPPAALEEAVAPGVTQLAERGHQALLADDLEGAAVLLRRCLSKDPSHAPCHRWMAEVQANRRRNQVAVRHYRRYLELAPEADDVREVRAMVQALERRGAAR